MNNSLKGTEMSTREEAQKVVGCFVTVYANSEHWRGAYVPQAAESAQWAADQVACTALDIEPGTLLALAALQPRPPYLTRPRELWIQTTTVELTIAALELAVA